jgi:hypothetical protein
MENKFISEYFLMELFIIIKKKPTDIIMIFKDDDKYEISYKMAVHKEILLALHKDYFETLFQMNKTGTIECCVPKVDSIIFYNFFCRLYGIENEHMINIPNWKYILQSLLLTEQNLSFAY